MVLAAAGVHRMGWGHRIGEYLGPDVCLHAVGQGSIGVECRAGDREVLELVRAVTHTESTLRCSAERAFMRQLEGGCSIPLGVWTEYSRGTLRMVGAVYSLDGARKAHAELTMTVSTEADAESTGVALAELARSRGADEILRSIPRAPLLAAPS